MLQMLPQSFLQFNGVAQSENQQDSRRTQLRTHLRSILGMVTDNCIQLLDAAADQQAKVLLFATNRVTVFCDL